LCTQGRGRYFSPAYAGTSFFMCSRVCVGIYMCVHECIHKYIHKHIEINIYIYMYMNAYINIYANTFKYAICIYVYTHIYLCLYLHMYVRVHIFMSLFTYVCTCTYICLHTYREVQEGWLRGSWVSRYCSYIYIHKYSCIFSVHIHMHMRTERCKKDGVEVRGCPATVKALQCRAIEKEADWATEYRYAIDSRSLLPICQVSFACVLGLF
jgi:hypothetical protein